MLVRLWRREQEDPEPFYRLLAARSAEDIDRAYGPLTGQTIVDLGCGPGFYTQALRERGATVIPVDNDFAEMTYAGEAPEGAVVADAADLPLETGSVDGAFCSNMLEHTPTPERVIAEIERVLRPHGWAYLSWTNWWSPWGGHNIAPYHFLGPRLGPRLHDRFHGPAPKNRVGEGLFPTYIGRMLRLVERRPGLSIERVEPRYWPRLAFITRIPVAREVLTWNCVIRAVKQPPG
jgi:SAM-dependent methyltransferase